MHMARNSQRPGIILTTLAGLLAFLTAASPGADAAPHPTGDCTRVTQSSRALCALVSAQHAYGWTDNAGHPQNWMVNGRALVHEITHGGLTQGEMRDALTAAHRDYRTYVTHVTFSMDAIRARCGTDGMGAVQFVDEDGKPGGRKYTWRRIICA